MKSRTKSPLRRERLPVITIGNKTDSPLSASSFMSLVGDAAPPIQLSKTEFLKKVCRARVRGIKLKDTPIWKKLEPRIIRRKEGPAKRAYITEKEYADLLQYFFEQTKDRASGARFMHALSLGTEIQNDVLAKLGIRRGARDRPRPRNKSGKSFAELARRWNEKYPQH